jgi:hypothetical protein
MSEENDQWGLCTLCLLDFEIVECRIIQERHEHFLIIDDQKRAHTVVTGKARESFERRLNSFDVEDEPIEDALRVALDEIPGGASSQ